MSFAAEPYAFMSRSSPPEFLGTPRVQGTSNEPLSGSGMNIRFALPAARIARLLGGGVAILVLLHLIGTFCHMVLHVKAAAFITLFDLDLESNLPTFYNCLLFFVCAGLFLAHSRLWNVRQRYGWLVMTGACAFLGVDEGSQIHEKFMLVTLRLLNHGQNSGTDLGWLYYAWVLPYGIAAALLVLTLTKWMLALDGAMRRGFILSGLIYVTGAVFMEMYSGRVAEHLAPSSLAPGAMDHLPCEVYPANSCHLYTSARYIAAYTLEETLEMVALVVCAYTLMKGLGKDRVTIEIATAPLNS